MHQKLFYSHSNSKHFRKSDFVPFPRKTLIALDFLPQKLNKLNLRLFLRPALNSATSLITVEDSKSTKEVLLEINAFIQILKMESAKGKQLIQE